MANLRFIKSLKTFFMILLIFIPSGKKCYPFFTTVEYPENSLGDLSTKQIGLSTQGELIVLRDSTGNEPPPENKFGNTFILISWRRILVEKWDFISQVDFVIRNTSLQCLDNCDPFYIMLSILENLCFLAEMQAWKKVFFEKHPTIPTMYDDSINGRHQRLRVILESARAYSHIASFIEKNFLDKRLPFFSAKPYLVIWGYSFLLDQSMKFYKKYFHQVSDHLSKVSKNKNSHLMTLQLALNMNDARNFRAILADEELSKLTLMDKQTIAGVIYDIERISCGPTQPLPYSPRPQNQQSQAQNHPMEQQTCVPQHLLPNNNYFYRDYKGASAVSKALSFLPLIKLILGFS